jgi:hypothetical protein
MAQDSGRSELKKAGRHRLDDARTLLRFSRWRGAMYLAGYSVECLLKTKLMRMFGCMTLGQLEDELTRRNLLPPAATVFTQQLFLLMHLTGRMNALRQNNPLWGDFNMVNEWLPGWRYSANPASQGEAADFLAAVERVLHWIDVNV